MEDKTKNRVRDLLYGILLAFIFVSFIFSVAAIVFSEFQNPNLALSLTLALSFLSAAFYWIFEYCVKVDLIFRRLTLFAKFRICSRTYGYNIAW